MYKPTKSLKELSKVLELIYGMLTDWEMYIEEEYQKCEEEDAKLNKDMADRAFESYTDALDSLADAIRYTENASRRAFEAEKAYQKLPF